MTDGINLLGSSNQQPSLKRCRAEDLDSGGSGGRSGCQYGSCRRPARIHDKFCGPTHKDFFMSDLADIHEHGGACMTEQQSRVCKLPGCDLSVWVDSDREEDFCRKRHALEYIEGITLRWAENGRLCKLEGCTHHVWVDETTAKCDDFCVFQHAMQAAAAKALSSLHKKPRIVEPAKTDAKGQSSDEIREESASQEAPRQGKAEKDLGYHLKLSEDVMKQSLICLINNPGDFENADPSGSFCRIKQITDNHPWKIVSGYTPRYFLSDFDSKRRNSWSTKKGFTYRQTGSSHGSDDLVTTYRYYKYKGEINDAGNDDELGENEKAYRDYEAGSRATTITRWKMHQIVLSDDILQKYGSPTRRPVIWKIFQDKNGEPVWPPVDKEEARAIRVPANESNASVSEGTFPEVTFGVEEMGITSSISSNASPFDGLPSEVQYLPEATNSSETEGCVDVSSLWDLLACCPANLDYPLLLDDIFPPTNGGSNYMSDALS